MELASYSDLACHLVNTDPTGRPEDDELVDVDGALRMLTNPTAGSWQPKVTEDDVEQLRELRAGLRAVFEAAAEDRQDDAAEELNRLLDGSVIRPRLTDHDGDGWHLHIYDGASESSAAYRAAAVMGLAVLLAESGIDRLGVCQAAPCRRVFIDTSTNRSRRYCSDRCATRANVAAYRARRRAAG